MGMYHLATLLKCFVGLRQHQVIGRPADRQVIHLKMLQTDRNRFFQPLRNMPDFADVTSPPSGAANPTIASYNASVVIFYNVIGSLARFENKNILF
jgi:hypothetical protein